MQKTGAGLLDKILKNKCVGVQDAVNQFVSIKGEIQMVNKIV